MPLATAFPPQIKLLSSDAESLLPSCQEMQQLEQATVVKGISAEMLMERAGKAIAERLVGEGVAQPVVVLCGSGNNGGDGLVVARELERSGFRCRVVVANAQRATALNMQHVSARIAAGKEVLFYRESSSVEKSTAITNDQLRQLLAEAGTVIDALLGIGQRAAPHGAIGEIVTALQVVPAARIVAIDTPTGINPSTGEAYTPCVRAGMTIAVQCIKRGMVQYPARGCCGTMSVVAVGIDTTGSVEWRVARRERPERGAAQHKGSVGKVAVIGGCFEMPGAPHLTGRAALLSGAGLVTLVVPTSVRIATSLETPELTYRLVAGDKLLDGADVIAVAKAIEGVDAVAIGPGLGRDPGTRTFVLGILECLAKQETPVVLDADGLYHLGRIVAGSVPVLPRKLVLTPHVAEMGRLLGCTVDEVERDRYQAARTLAQICRCVVVLKGPGSIIAFPGGTGAVCIAGNGYMATAGSGDVLTGIIAALMAQGVSCEQGAETGVVMHAEAGDACARKYHGPILASQIAEEIQMKSRFSD